MRPTDKAKFLETLAGVHDFYGKELSAFAGQVWWEACRSFEFEQVTKALSAHLMDPERGQFMPKPADLVRALQGTNTDRSLIAWGKLLDAMQRVGAYTSVCFDDPVIHAVVDDLGGWVKACRTTHDELPYLQNRFCASYKAYAGRGGDIAYPARLTGANDQANAAKGFSGPPPTLIGDPTRAKAVMEQGVVGPKTQITAGDAIPRLRIEGKQA